MEPVKFTAPAQEFCRAVRNAALFAGTDKTMPVLMVVHLRLVDGVMVAEATDRYATAQHMIRDTEGDPGGLLLVAANAARSCKALAKLATGRSMITVEWSPGDRTATAWLDTAEYARADIDVMDLGQHYTEPGYADRGWPLAPTIDRNWDAHFRRVAKIRHKRGPYWDRRQVYRLSLLDRLNKIDTSEQGTWRNADLQFTGEGDAVAVSVGASFRALLMPVRGA
jgi:hypothetical protein